MSDRTNVIVPFDFRTKLRDAGLMDREASCHMELVDAINRLAERVHRLENPHEFLKHDHDDCDTSDHP